MVTVMIILIGLPSALSYTALKLQLFGIPLLEIGDFAFGTVGIIAAGLILSIVAGWFIDQEIINSFRCS